MKTTRDSNHLSRPILVDGRTRKIALAIAFLIAVPVFAQQQPFFTPGNVVVSVEGNGVSGAVSGPYGDNQAAPFTLFQFAPNGTSPTSAAASFVNSLVFPQLPSGMNFPVSGEYGSSSEATLQLSGGGQYLTVMGYGINAAIFNGNSNAYSATANDALAQSGSLPGQGYIPVPRVVTFIDGNGNVNSSTALYNIFSTNNPRSVYTLDGTHIYVSGQGESDATGGVFYTTFGAINNAPVSISGADAGSGDSQDTRDVQIYNNTLYVSSDSKAGATNRDYIGTLGTAGTLPTSLANSGNGPTMLKGFGNSGGTGRPVITAAQTNGFSAAGDYINLSPENFFFASPSVLYVTDSGSPKNTSAENQTPYSLCGAGGLQKWVNISGTWTWEYTLYNGLNLVANGTCSTNTAGATGLLGLTGTVSNGVAQLFATNYNIGDLDPTYLYGISDTLSATTNPGTSFTVLATAPADSNFKGVALAPTVPAGSVEVTTSPSGLTFTTAGAGCTPGTYVAPVTLAWTPGSSCTLNVVSPQAQSPSQSLQIAPTGIEYAFSQWEDGTASTSHTVTAPATTAVYTATFATQYQLTTSAGTGGTVSPSSGFVTSPATITATPNVGYYFVNFTGATTSTNNPLSLPLTGAASIAANFAPLPTVVSYNVLWGTESYNAIGTSRNRLPWQITGIQVVFSEPISTASLSSLTGVTATGLSGLGTATLTWTISPIALGNYASVLSGSGPSAILDASGNPLGAGAGFSQNVKVLYGDVNDDGVVNSQDLVLVNNATRQAYNLLMDLNGDGVVNTADVKLDQSRAGTSLP